MSGFVARNLAEAHAQANPLQRLRMALGRGQTRALTETASGIDRGLQWGARRLLSAGQEGGVAHSAVEGLGGVAKVFRKAPLAAKLTAVSVPAGLHLYERSADRLTPLVNEAIEEGRAVYANDQTFLTKLAGYAAKLDSGEKRAAPIGDFFMGLGKTPNLMGALGTAFGGAQNPSSRMGHAGSIVGGLGPLANTVSGVASTLGGGMLDTAKYQVNRRFNPLTDRVKADETFASNFFSSLGSETAKQMVGLLKDMAGKAITRVQHMPAQNAMVQNLQASDPMLARATPEDLANAYHTMATFAPTLSTDENAVRSFLREAVMAGSGPDYATIANLAKAENDIARARNPAR